MSPASVKVPVTVEGRTLTLSNLAKVLYPAEGFTKAQVLDYYTRIAPVLLPHLHDRPLTLKRYPDGVDGKSFFEKNAPSHAPDWVRTARLASPGSTKKRETIDYTVVDDLPTLVWAANLASIELHTPLWRVAAGEPDLLVFDLDPGPPATIVECAQVAHLLREILMADGLPPLAKTSGSKGMQLYCAIAPGFGAEQTSAYAKGLAQRLASAHPDLVVWQMTKALRPGKVLVDWSQNNGAKTTVSVYSMRARPRPTVSTPVTWEEVADCERAGDPDLLVFTTDDVLARVARVGDLFSPLLAAGAPLPG
ncbi:MAG: non-homologous end-joining DNA ligase [Actinomycetota bacterium]|nr:non-homologous end-joining DNA ligase [Actinomycetota bacterium]